MNLTDLESDNNDENRNVVLEIMQWKNRLCGLYLLFRVCLQIRVPRQNTSHRHFDRWASSRPIVD
jgi:hypothetical protein